MEFRFRRTVLALALVLAVWWLSGVRRSMRLPSVAAGAGPVRILRFYASAGTIVMGQKAKLCYGVENAKSVHISPELDDVYPSPSHCLEVVPERTTHYTILAEGFDGAMATRSFTLAVQPSIAYPLPVHYAEAW
jgi:hypothetical protein